MTKRPPVDELATVDNSALNDTTGAYEYTVANSGALAKALLLVTGSDLLVAELGHLRQLLKRYLKGLLCLRYSAFKIDR